VVNERGLFAFLDRVDAKRRRLLTLPAVIERRANRVKQMPGLHREPAVVVGFDWNFRYSRSKPIEVDDQISRWPWSGRRGVFFLGLLGFVALFFGDRHFVAFGREGTLHILAKRHRKDPRGP